MEIWKRVGVMRRRGRLGGGGGVVKALDAFSFATSAIGTMHLFQTLPYRDTARVGTLDDLIPKKQSGPHPFIAPLTIQWLGEFAEFFTWR